MDGLTACLATLWVDLGRHSSSRRGYLSLIRGVVATILFVVFSSTARCTQSSLPAAPNRQTDDQQEQASDRVAASSSQLGQETTTKTQTQEALQPTAVPPKDDSEGKQTKRMFWVIPNFAAVSANTQLPPLSVRGKFALATQDSVDYSSFVWTGILAGQSLALNTYPELGKGAAGYGRYYWRGFVDQASGAFFTEALVPALTHEDPRYYTLGHGSFLRRTGYALSRVVLTKTDSGGVSFNFSEVLGNGMVAGLSNLYYPPEERGLRKTAENWATGLESAALNNLVKEFWPDIRHKILRQK
jgi:hypothetical protein